MKKNYVLLFVLSLLLVIPFGNADAQKESIAPEKVITPVHSDVSKALRDIEPVPPGIRDRSWKEKVIKNMDGFLEEFKRPSIMIGPDPVLQDEVSSTRDEATVGENFTGLDNASGVAPPDTQGDVGPNHYFQMVNSQFRIWDKNGTPLTAAADIITIWDGFTGPWSSTNDGDPIVLYDEYSDRWIVTQFSLPNYPNGPFYELIAVSTSGDPTGTYTRYAYSFDNMPDYPKFGVWPDGYYMAINQFAPPSLNFAGGGIVIFERDEMINGNSNAQAILFSLSTAYGSLLPADADGATLPPSGDPCYFANVGTNEFRIWEVDVDWTNTNNSTATLVNTLSTASYSYSGISINQPGTSQILDDLAPRLMYRLRYLY